MRRPIQSALLGPSPPPSTPRAACSWVVAPQMAAIPMTAYLLAALLLVLVLLLVGFFACCRRRASLPSSRAPIEAEDLNRPLLPGSFDETLGQSNDLVRNIGEESRIQIDENSTSSRADGSVSNKRVHSIQPCLSQDLPGDSLVLDVKSYAIGDLQASSTLKRTASPTSPAPDVKHARRDTRDDVGFNGHNGKNRALPVRDSKFLRSSLALEVISGASQGLCCSRQSTSASNLPLTLGRIPPSDLIVKDSEVSGKHALINWNVNTLKWELVDMGSLNGTFLNSQAIHHPDVGSRHWSEPAELADGDTIILGSSSKVSVHIAQHIHQEIPTGIGVASDPMAARRGGKKLPMEDVCFFQYPLPDVEQFGLFGIFDGHGGDGAAKAASKILPEHVEKLLSLPETKDRILSTSDASDVLRRAFGLTEAAMDHQYEGCTATVLLIWFNQDKECFVQCANVGDSLSVLSVDGKQVSMTEDHRVTSMTERTRIARTGRPLKDGETRLCGLNICRMLGDKFLKEQDMRFSSEPFVSQVVCIAKTSMAFALIASDGLWDVITPKNAVQLVLKYKERNRGQIEKADEIANHVLNEARTLRTKDNTSVIFLDFGMLRTDSCII